MESAASRLGIERAVPLAFRLAEYSFVNVLSLAPEAARRARADLRGQWQSEVLYLVHPNEESARGSDVPAAGPVQCRLDNEGNPPVVSISPGVQGARAIGAVDPRNGRVAPLPKEAPSRELQLRAVIERSAAHCDQASRDH